MKKLFLERLIHEEIGVQQFFGDWFKVLGVQDTGYFLGAKMMEGLSHHYTIEEIANLDLAEIELKVLSFLKAKIIMDKSYSKGQFVIIKRV